MSLDQEYCPHCGQKLGYKSAISRGTVEVLKKISRVVDEKGINAVHIEKEMVQKGILTGNQGRNCTHMVRHGLLAHIEGKAGNYCITRKGMGFLRGEAIPKFITVSKANQNEGSRTVDHGEEMVTIRQFSKSGEYWEVPNFDIREGQVIRTPAQLFS